MNTNEDMLQELQRILTSEPNQEQSYSLLKESVYYELKDPPQANLYPNLYAWYMSMRQRIQHPLKAGKQFKSPGSIQAKTTPQFENLSQQKFTLKASQQLIQQAQNFNKNFIQGYQKLSQGDYVIKKNYLSNRRIAILKDFELLLYRIDYSFYKTRIFHEDNFYSYFQKQIKDILLQVLKDNKSKFGQYQLNLWIKDEFLEQIKYNKQYQDKIKQQFIQQGKDQFNNIYQMPFNKVYDNNRIIVIKDLNYQNTIRMVLQRYPNYQKLTILKYLEFSKLNYPDHKIYNQNNFYFCLDKQITISDTYENVQFNRDQLQILKQNLNKIKFQLTKHEQKQKLKLDKSCNFHTQNLKKDIKQSFINYRDQMNNKNYWHSQTPKKQIKKLKSDITKGKDSKRTMSQILKCDSKQFAKIHNLPNDIVNVEYNWKYQWTHIIAKSLGGNMQWDNGFVGPSFFNRMMERYEKWLVNINENPNFNSHGLTQIQYKLQLTHPQYPKPDQKYIFGPCAQTVKIEIIAIYTLSSNIYTVQLLSHQFNPFLKIYPMMVQLDLFTECVQQLCGVLDKKKLIKNQSQNGPLFEMVGRQLYLQVRAISFNNIKDYFKQKIQGQTLKLFEGLNIKVKVTSSEDSEMEDKQDEFYSVQVLQMQFSILDKLCGRNIFLSQITETLKIDEISFHIHKNILGFFVVIKSQPFGLPEAIASVVNTVFNFSKPVLVFEGSMHFRDNLLTNPQTPDYFQIKASLEEMQPKSEKNIEDLSYSFQNLNLTFVFQKEQKGDYGISWSISCLVNIYKLSESPIKLQALFRRYYGQNELSARIVNRIDQLMGISWLSVQQLDLMINFTQKQITLWFAFEISSVRLSMKTSYGSKLIQMKCSIQNLTINDVLAIINKFIGTELSVSLDLTFENISLQIIINKQNKENIFNFEIQFKIGQTTFEGYLHHEKKSLQLQATADLITFEILRQQITLTQPTLNLITNEKFDELKYTGTMGYKSKSSQSSNSANITTIIGMQKSKQSSHNDYWLQADVQLNLQPKLNNFLQLFTAIDKLKIVYKTQGYQPIKMGDSGKYISVQTKKFSIFNKSVSMQIRFDFQKLILTASVDIDYDKKDTKSFLLLEKVGLQVNLNAIQIGLFVQCVSPRLNNAQFKGKLIFGPGKIGVEIQMFGIQKINDYVEIGFQKSSEKSTKLLLAYDNQTVDYQMNAAIKVFDCYGEGNIVIKKDVLTKLQITAYNIDFIKIIKSLINVIRSDDKQNTKKMIQFSQKDAEAVKILTIDQLYFNYDIINLNIEARLITTIFDNQFDLGAKVSKSGIAFHANIQKPISIIDIISLSSASDPTKGPDFNISLQETNFKIYIDCRIHFGPITSKTYIHVDSTLLSCQIGLYLFDFGFDAKILMDKDKGTYRFDVVFLQDQRNKTSNFVQDIAGQNYKLQQSKSKDITEDIIKQTRKAQRQFVHGYHKRLNQERKHCDQKKNIMKQLFSKQVKQLKQKANLKRRQQVNNIEKQIKQIQVKIKELNNYIHYHKGQSSLYSQQNSIYHGKNINQAKQKIESLQNDINILKDKQKGHAELYKASEDKLDSMYSSVNKHEQVKLQGWWDSFVSWVKGAFETIIRVVKEVVDEIKDYFPHVSYFAIGAYIQQNNQSVDFTAYCKFKFKIFKQQFSVMDLKWTTHFDSHTIQQKSISRMVEISLSYVRSVYLIPKVYYKPFENKSQEEVYNALEEGTLKGISIKNNTFSLTETKIILPPQDQFHDQLIEKKQLEFSIQNPFLSIGKAQLIDIYENKNTESVYRYCIAKQLAYFFSSQKINIFTYFYDSILMVRIPKQQLIFYRCIPVKYVGATNPIDPNKIRQQLKITENFLMSSQFLKLKYYKKYFFNIKSYIEEQQEYKVYELNDGAQWLLTQNQRKQDQLIIFTQKVTKTLFPETLFPETLNEHISFFTKQGIRQTIGDQSLRFIKSIKNYPCHWKQLKPFPKLSLQI